MALLFTPQIFSCFVFRISPSPLVSRQTNCHHFEGHSEFNSHPLYRGIHFTLILDDFGVLQDSNNRSNFTATSLILHAFCSSLKKA